MNKILVIDFCNFIDYQIGGHLSFVKNMMAEFKNQLTLIGITTDKNDPLGRWISKKIDGIDYDFFALARYSGTKTKHIVPDRVMCFWLLKYYRTKILQKNFQNVFVQRQEILPAIKKFGYKNICYRFPGVENPLKISKYWYGKYATKGFENLFFPCLSEVSLILASADEKAIKEMIARSKGKITRQSVIQFPSRINTNIFKPIEKIYIREKLMIPATPVLITTTGRLTWLKGWKLMIDSFMVFEKEFPGSLFYFIGEGEDFQKINKYIEVNGLIRKVKMVGRKSPEDISFYLNASDLFIMGSFKEGWPTSLVEAVACGLPACVTDFSAASEILIEGQNGYIEKRRDPVQFAELMSNALKLEIKDINVSKYSNSSLKRDILHYWRLE